MEPVHPAARAADLQPAPRPVRARPDHLQHLLRLDARPRLPAGAGAGLRRQVPRDLQGVPAAPEGGELQPRKVMEKLHACGRSSRLLPARSSPSTACGRWRRSTPSGGPRSRSRPCSRRHGRPRRGRRGGADRARDGDPRRHDDRRVRGHRPRLARDTARTRRPGAPTPRWSTSPCSRCSSTSGPTASRPTSSPAAASSSCASWPRRSTASRPSRSSARASRRSSR
jgi:hypothetical protein